MNYLGATFSEPAQSKDDSTLVLLNNLKKFPHSGQNCLKNWSKLSQTVVKIVSKIGQNCFKQLVKIVSNSGQNSSTQWSKYFLPHSSKAPHSDKYSPTQWKIFPHRTKKFPQGDQNSHTEVKIHSQWSPRYAHIKIPK